jgi:hypothetical protein
MAGAASWVGAEVPGTPGGGGLCLREVVASAEARLFVGRAAELAALEQALAESASGPQVVYVHGPAGGGKTALLRRFRARAEACGAAVLSLDASGPPPGPAALLRGLEGGADGINRSAQHAPVVLLFDAYDQLRASDSWLREAVLYGLGRGVLVVLAGRLAPRELWACDAAWLAAVRPLAVPDLSPAEAQEYLLRAGLQDPGLRREVAWLAGGRPLLLQVFGALALRSGPPWAAEPRERGGLGARLLTEFTRDASRPELREVLAAAAVVQAFDRDLLAAMVGPEAVARAWDDLVSLPVVVPVGRRHTVLEPVRVHLAAAATRERPWAVRRWRRRALEVLLRPGILRAERAEVAGLAAYTLWRPWLHPRAEAERGWAVQRAAREADLPQLEATQAAFLGVLGWDADEQAAARDALRRFLAVWPAGFAVVRSTGGDLETASGGDGRILAWVCLVPVRAATREALLAEPSLGPYLAAQDLAALEGRTLAFCQAGIAQPETEAHHVLIREIFADFGAFERALAVTPDARIQAFLLDLGFRAEPGPGTPVRGGSRHARAFTLDLAGSGYADWLRGRLAATCESGIAPAQWADAAAAALEGEDPIRPDLAHAYRRLFEEVLDRDALSAWVADGLDEFRATDGDLARLLSAYHVERVGSHEAVAERLALSQRTYYRRRRRALEELGRILFA